VPSVEHRYQLRWIGYKNLMVRLRDWLAGRPALIVPGNHDFIGLAAHLASVGADAQQITPAGVEAAGLKWAGFLWTRRRSCSNRE
jgi:hypothetical protein